MSSTGSRWVRSTGDPVSSLQDKYAAEGKRYSDDQKAAEAEARGLENKTDEASKRADRFDLAEVFLEVALVITSITLLSGKRLFWYAGIAFGAMGTAVAFGILSHWMK